jgi:uncharacterized protein YkwD
MLGSAMRMTLRHARYLRLLQAGAAAACLVVALPAAAQTQATGAAVARPLASAEEALVLVNAQRAAGAHCGGEWQPPAPPLRWHAAMEAAATEHLHDVAARGLLSHDGSDGSTVGGRIRRHGYAWGAAGENLAAGHRSAAGTVQQWLRSPAHCRTLMQGNYRDMALVGREVPGSRHGAWWVLVLARPLQ